MLKPTRVALNRIIYPNLDLQGFMALAAELGLSMVELRNDLPDRRIADGMEPQQHPPSKDESMKGQLKDPGLKTLLKDAKISMS